MSEGSLTTNQLLMAIQEYLNGLDNIIMPDKLGTSTGGNQFCESPPYGHFVVVVNKMMGSDPDEKLQEELMNPEPEFTEDARTRNKIRRQLEECFEDGVTVHGLPILTVPSGKTKNFLLHLHVHLTQPKFEINSANYPHLTHIFGIFRQKKCKFCAN